MYELLEYCIRGSLLGVTYGVLAFPIALLFIATDAIDLAVGAYAVIAGAVCLLIDGPAGILMALLASMGAAAVVGGISLGLGSRSKSDQLTLVLASFGLALFLESMTLSLFGGDPFIKRSSSVFWSIAGISISPQAVLNLAVGLALLGALYMLLYRSVFGREMRASAVNHRGANLAGIPVRKLQFLTFLLSGFLAGSAGLLIVYTAGMDFAAGLHLTLSGFGAAIIFGLRGPLQGFAGGLAIGVVEALSFGYASGALASLIPLIFIFVVLAFGRSSLQGVAGRA
jgi:branched-subunit amino acid ABC-type transport system permease component